MIFSHIISLVLRVSQFVFAAIVLGLTAYFVYKIENPDRGPRGRRDRRDRWDDDDRWDNDRWRDRWDATRWRDDDDRDPLGRLIFALVWSSLSIIFAVIWAIPTTFAMKGFISDFIFTAGWAAVFGLLVDWFNDANCGSPWAWGGLSLRRGDTCGQWRAAQAFSFLSLIVWFATGILGIIMVLRLRRRAAAAKNSRV
ncbi:hypothetical protein COCSADRAFT_258027 [Bipolaris sorokiniana ND90Pr]|uniref:MARVEL domain-containing protein n=1 Tax=Cochliobolus sativus (strain ND90Pr / ATCC 201652) TaxID=665912 RepID=M2QWA4_COCSN|nr:uncharacterized protein COCSADRAFT_258027 [Bipolaris sorokiniana ND90Pr]EMD59384.1 hypothetical protein COCSADRAFT_258027 [Bipolaris sorokiniana ND90Pr]